MQEDNRKKALIIGSGPIIIGQACEFDYSGTQACKALRKLGYKVVLVNSNPATIMTDPTTADVTYIEPLNKERLEQIIAKERPDVLLPNLGGQSGLNLCSELDKSGVLAKYGVKVIGFVGTLFWSDKFCLNNIFQHCLKGLSVLLIHSEQEARQHDEYHHKCRKACPCAVFEQKEKRQSDYKGCRKANNLPFCQIKRNFCFDF